MWEKSKRISLAIYSGPSLIDRKPIMAVASCLNRKSNNTKTGDMAQVVIMRRDIMPNVARKSGKDVSVCGQCPLRPTKEGGCYVRLWGTVGSYKKYARGNMPMANFNDLPEIGSKKPVRMGTYGNPSAVPIRYWRKLLEKAPGHTGYDFRWKSIHKSWADIVMASVRSSEQRKVANKRGFRTFRILFPGDKPERGEIMCPASKQSSLHGKITCAKCGLCNGLMGRTKNALKDIFIFLHGPRRKRS